MADTLSCPVSKQDFECSICLSTLNTPVRFSICESRFVFFQLLHKPQEYFCCCLKVMTECAHYFCSTCLESVSGPRLHNGPFGEMVTNQPFLCPQCRSECNTANIEDVMTNVKQRFFRGLFLGHQVFENRDHQDFISFVFLCFGIVILYLRSCENSEEGCTWVGPLQQRDNHMKECEHRIVYI